MGSFACLSVFVAALLINGSCAVCPLAGNTYVNIAINSPTGLVGAYRPVSPLEEEAVFPGEPAILNISACSSSVKFTVCACDGCGYFNKSAPLNFTTNSTSCVSSSGTFFFTLLGSNTQLVFTASVFLNESTTETVNATVTTNMTAFSVANATMSSLSNITSSNSTISLVNGTNSSATSNTNATAITYTTVTTIVAVNVTTYAINTYNFTITFLRCALTPSAPHCQQRAALVGIRSNSSLLTFRWNMSTSFCEWAGLGCSHGLLKTMSLARSLRSMTLPYLATLNTLTHLNMSSNLLQGTIDDFGLFNMNLVSLDLSNNSLTGAIPSYLFQNTLRIFNVSNNNLTSSVPSLDSSVNLTSFLIANNSLTGALSLANLLLLRNISLAQQQSFYFSCPIALPPGLNDATKCTCGTPNNYPNASAVSTQALLAGDQVVYVCDPGCAAPGTNSSNVTATCGGFLISFNRI